MLVHVQTHASRYCLATYRLKVGLVEQILFHSMPACISSFLFVRVELGLFALVENENRSIARVTHIHTANATIPGHFDLVSTVHEIKYLS